MSIGNRNMVIVLLLWLAIAAIYLPSARYGFFSVDDPENIGANDHLANGFTREAFHWAMTGFLMGHWTPVVRITYLVDQTLFHLNPHVMHVEDVAIHAAGSSMLFILLLSATGAVWRSAIVAALFAVHPMHVESVVWLTERRDVLSTAFLFAAMWAYVRYSRAVTVTRWIWFVFSLSLFSLSLMSKAMGITLPIVLLLMDFWPLQRIQTTTGATVSRFTLFNLILEKIPYAVLSVAAAVLALQAQRAAGATTSIDVLPLSSRLGNIALTFPSYIVKLAVPTNLAVFYPHPGDWPMIAVIAGAALLASVTVFTVRQRKRRPYLIVGWLWFLIMLMPVSGLAQSGPQAMADRYSYVPSVGLFLAIVWYVGDLAKSAGMLGRRVSTAATWLLLASFIALACRQVRYWRDSETLFHHAIEVTGSNWCAHWGLAGIAYDHGDLATSVDECHRSIADRAINPEAYAGLGFCWQSDPAKAVKYFRLAVAYAPQKTSYRVALAADLVQLNHLDEAAAQLRAALSVDPQNKEAIAGLADVQSRRRKEDRQR